MDITQKRNAASDLVDRLAVPLSKCSNLDEEKHRPQDRSPGFIDVVMPEPRISIEEAANLNLDDWELIQTALEHYTLCDIAG
ncbi:MAG: hypothetical protein ACRENA_12275 [Vulcanimicrobiaceae bacterium]